MNVRQLFSAFQTTRRQLRRSRNPRRGTAGIEVLETRQLLAADVGVLKDIIAGNTGSLVSAGNGDNFAVEYNGLVYFTANDGTHGFELWRTDGTLANTERFMDLRTGFAPRCHHHILSQMVSCSSMPRRATEAVLFMSLTERRQAQHCSQPRAWIPRSAPLVQRFTITGAH